MIEVSSSFKDEMMALAISEARKGAGCVSPNPQVGCVIVSAQGKIISKGYHQKFGGPHAEVQALTGVPEKELQGASVFVTLEPCAHEGKTPSCAKALAKLPLAQVIYGLVDPNPLVSGQGAEILRQAGIQTELYAGQWTSDLEEVCEHFLVNYREKRPFISLKVASSLDGQMALKSGESKWITGEEARQQAHYLRATHEAILIGQGTFELDDPSLNIRHPDFIGKTNKVIVVVGQKFESLKPKTSQIYKSHDPKNIVFLQKLADGYSELSLAQDGSLTRTKDQVDWNFNLTHRINGGHMAHSVLVEGGAQVLSSYLMRAEAHRLYLFQAPILLGAKGGKAWTEQVIVKSMKAKILLRNQRYLQLGQDQLITGRLSYE